MILTQTTALLVDAYRELNAKKLFWITMALSGVVVLVMASLGIDEDGVTFLMWDLSFIPINSEILEPGVFYKALFSNLGIGLWLSWAAAILALISTASVIPDLVSGGSIETVLSKPISRVRVFLTKYVMGLLFVALQVFVFSLGSFLVFGLRAGLWEPGLLLAVPIVVVFFSYLFCICALIGLLTRSTITSLLVTILFWFMLFILNAGDATLMQFRTMNEMLVEKEQARIALMEKNTAKVLRQQRERDGLSVEGWEPTADEIIAANPFLRTNTGRVERINKDLEKLVFWSDLVYGVKTALPKTGETTALLERHLVDLSELPQPEGDEQEINLDDEKINISDEEMSMAVQREFRSRSIGWIVGTSVIFECVVLGVCCLIFARRDF
ncbi:MAG: ABC transporter permease [Phycisphaerales bacterium]|nr:ABC transporter permease [Phycisphaerales bacterium]